MLKIVAKCPAIKKTLVLTVAMGEEYRRFVDEHFLPPMRKYAAKVGADFVVWEQGYNDQMFCHYWGAMPWIRDQGYDKVLIIDSDVLIKEDADNIFDVDFHMISMLPTPNCTIPRKLKIRFDKNYVPRVHQRDIHNAGVMLMDRCFVRWFAGITEQMKDEKFYAGDQMYMCWLCKKYGIVPDELDRKWNCHYKHKDSHASDICFVHFVGHGRSHVPSVVARHKSELLRRYYLRA